MSSYQPGLCIAVHRYEPERPRQALDGGYLCAGCLDSADRLLAALPDLLEDLERALIPGSSTGPKVSGNPDKALPYNELAAVVRKPLLYFIGSWASLIADERGHHLPADTRPASLCRWMRSNLSWIAAQPWCDEFLSNLRSDVAAGRSVLAGQRRKRVPVGACPDDDRCDVLSRTGVRCGGKLEATLDLSDDLLPTTVACSVCGRDYTARDLPALGQRLTGGAAWLTTAQAALVLGLSQDATRVRALGEGWRLRDSPGVRPRRWHAQDVEDSQKRRTA